MSEIHETNKIPDIKIQELLSVIAKVEMVDGYQFTYNGTDYYLCLLTEEDLIGEDATPGFYSASTAINGWDIYILATAPKAERDRILFHEILEVNLVLQNFSKNEAHQITLREEEKNFGSRGENNAK